MADGWAVEFAMQVLGGGESKQTYYAHIPDRVAAEEAVKRRISATPDVQVVARAPIPHATFEAHRVAEGDVSQWI